MPTSARKSSVGTARRGLQKAHIPYRGDNPEVGKKTGIAVQHVDRKSDGFESFEEIIQQADKRTPPKAKGRKRKKPIPVFDVDDENGEMSMELDDSNPNSPLEYFTNSRQPVTPSNVNRVGSSARPVIRSSDVDFDKLPSPRPRALARKSTANGFGPGPSNLSKSIVPQDLDPDPDPEDDDIDQGGIDGGFDDYGPQEGGSPDQVSPRRASFTEMDQDDDRDEEEPEEELPEVEVPVRTRRDKGKEREVPRQQERENDEEEDEQDLDPEEEQSMEDEIAQGMEDVALGQHSDEEAEEEPPRKKSRVENEKTKQAGGKSRGKLKKEWGAEPPEGVRRSQRRTYAPLEWWRMEKVVYGRRESGISLVPHIKEIRRIPKEDPEPLGTNKRKRGTTRPRSRSKVEENYDHKQPVMVLNPEEGWDTDTDQQAVVLNFPSMEEVTRRIAFTARMIEPKAAANNDWFFQKVFGDGDFIAAGHLIIPPQGRKPSKGTKDNTYIFYVIEGAVNLKVHDTSLILATGGMFMVPRGNTYFIENIADRDAKLFFTQARKIVMGEEEAAAQESGSPGPRRSSDSQPRKFVRSSSAGPPGPVNGRALSNAPVKRAVSTKI